MTKLEYLLIFSNAVTIGIILLFTVIQRNRLQEIKSNWDVIFSVLSNYVQFLQKILPSIQKIRQFELPNEIVDDLSAYDDFIAKFEKLVKDRDYLYGVNLKREEDGE